MQELILLSIIVPTYNYATHLGRCLLSVLPQLQSGAELIVVDDGSTDDTASVIARLMTGHNFCFVQQINQGAAAARNHGLRLSKGCFVLFLDADDELLPNTVQAVLEYLRKHPEIDMLLGGQVTRRPNEAERVSLPRKLVDDPCQRISDYLLRKRISLGHGSFVARKDLLLQRMYPESLRKREDIPVFAHLLAHARIAHIEHLMVRVNKHPTSLRHRTFEKDTSPMELVNEVFRSLPECCQPIRASYAAIRCLSLSRSALRLGDIEAGRQLLSKAWHLDWRQLIKIPAIKKTLRAWYLGRKQKK